MMQRHPILALFGLVFAACVPPTSAAWSQVSPASASTPLSNNAGNDATPSSSGSSHPPAAIPNADGLPETVEQKDQEFSFERFFAWVALNESQREDNLKAGRDPSWQTTDFAKLLRFSPQENQIMRTIILEEHGRAMKQNQLSMQKRQPPSQISDEEIKKDYEEEVLIYEHAIAELRMELGVDKFQTLNDCAFRFFARPTADTINYSR